MVVSDECPISVFPKGYKLELGAPIAPRLSERTSNPSFVTLHSCIFGRVRVYGKGPLIVAQSNINSDEYQRMLKLALQPMKKKFKNFIFQQDTPLLTHPNQPFHSYLHTLSLHRSGLRTHPICHP